MIINLGKLVGTAEQNRNNLNQAMLDAHNDGGGLVSFYGSHDVAGGLIAQSNVTLQNAASVAALRLVPNSEGNPAHLMDATLTDNFKSIGVDYDGNKFAFTQGAELGYHAFRGGKGSKGLRLKHATIKNGIYYGVGIQYDPNNPLPDTDIKLQDLRVLDCGGWSSAGATQGDGIDIKYALEVNLEDILASGSPQRGLDIRGRRIMANNIRGYNNGHEGVAMRGFSQVNGNPIPNAGHMLVSNIDTQGNGTFGMSVFLDEGATTDIRIAISNHSSYSNGADGIYIARFVNKVMAAITGAIYRNNGASGARIEADGIAIQGVLINNTKWGIDHGNVGSNHLYNCVYAGNGYGNIR